MPRVRKVAPPVDDTPVDLPPNVPRITRGDVAAWVGDATLRRAMPYLEDALFDTRRSEQILKAHCQGTAVQPYRVSATLGETGIVDDDCSCPVGGRCKHVAALLMAWIEDPDMFVPVEPTDVALERREKPELIALIKRMLSRNPELETLLELPTPSASRTPRPLDPARIRYQIDAAFRSASHDWHGDSEVADALEPLVQLGDEYVQAGDFHNAVIVFHTIIHGVKEHYDEVQDEGDITEVISACADGLGACLQNTNDRMQRESALRALFDIYRWNVELGGMGMADTASKIIFTQTTGADRRLLADWTREIKPERDSWSNQWRTQQIGQFLLRLMGDDLDDETFLEVSREHGLQGQIVERLVARKRFDEAEAEVRTSQDYQLLGFADLLREAGETERAERVVRERQPAPQFRADYLRWLRERAQERGDDAGALTLTEAMFELLKDPALYEEMKALAEKRGRWNTLRPQIVGKLQQERRFELLTEIYLREKDVHEALAAVRETKADATTTRGESLRVVVASAAENTHPHEAIGLYREVADQFIAAQGRENYRNAAQLLLRVRELYAKLNQQAQWRDVIAELRLRYRRSRALQEELDRATL